MKLELPFYGSMSLNRKVPGEVCLPVLSFLLMNRKEHKACDSLFLFLTYTTEAALRTTVN